MDGKPPQDEASGDVIQRPEAAHSIERYDTDSDDELEATELRSLDEATEPLPRLSHVISPHKPMVHWYDPAKKFWRHYVRISVPHVDCRDHLANERTFLGYLRTSLALSIIGVMIAQLYRLQHSEHPDPVFGYYVLSKPLASLFYVAALCVVLLGSVRFWRQQNAMSIGKMHAGGFELVTIGVGCLLLLVMMFAVHLGLDIYKEDYDEPQWNRDLTKMDDG